MASAEKVAPPVLSPRAANVVARTFGLLGPLVASASSFATSAPRHSGTHWAKVRPLTRIAATCVAIKGGTTDRSAWDAAAFRARVTLMSAHSGVKIDSAQVTWRREAT